MFMRNVPLRKSIENFYGKFYVFSVLGNPKSDEENSPTISPQFEGRVDQ